MVPPMLVAAVAMAADASWAITVSAEGTVQTWGTGGPSRVIHWAVPVDGSQPVAVARAGDRIRVLWVDEAAIRLHENVRGSRPREAECRAPAPVRALAMSPSGVLAAVACADGTLRTMNAGTGEFGPELATSGRTARAVAVASDVGPVVAVFGDGSVRRYDPGTGTSDMMGAGPGVDLVAVTPDGETVIAAKRDGVLSRLDLSGAGPAGDAGPLSGRFRLLGTAITAIAVDGTGRRVLASRPDGTLWLHDMAGGPATELHVPEASPDPEPPDQRWWESAGLEPAPAPRTPAPAPRTPAPAPRTPAPAPRTPAPWAPEPTAPRAPGPAGADADTEVWSLPVPPPGPAAPAPPEEPKERIESPTATYRAEAAPPVPRPDHRRPARPGPRWWLRWRRP